MDELILNRIANQLGVALVNNAILQNQVEALQAENARLNALLAEKKGIEEGAA